MVVALWIAAGTLCAGLCAYGISKLVRRSKNRDQALVPR